MFHSLPADTVFEARVRAKRDTVLLFLLLFLVNILFFSLMAAAGYLFLVLGGWYDLWGPDPFESSGLKMSFLAGAVLALLLAAFHFMLVRGRDLNVILGILGAKPADPGDPLQAPFVDIVQEVELAAGVRGIRPVFLNSSGCNAFCLQDKEGRSAIGVTKGLLQVLDRAELSAVVAQQASRLAFEDAKMVTTACFLFQVFGDIHSGLNAGMEKPGRGYSLPDGAAVNPMLFVLWVLSGMGYFFTNLAFSALNRQREFMADIGSVRMAKDPIALSEALYKMSRRSRGGFPEVYAPLFILHPFGFDSDEEGGVLAEWVGTHPQVRVRLERILAWAKAHWEILQDGERKGFPHPQEPSALRRDLYQVYLEGNWLGPWTALQLASRPGCSPVTWVCPEGTQEVRRACDVPGLKAIFQMRIPGPLTFQDCPRCKVPLVQTAWEGMAVEACHYCGGRLLGPQAWSLALSGRGAEGGKDRKAVPSGTKVLSELFPVIRCPACGKEMGKEHYPAAFAVVVDRCPDPSCGQVWCDGGELEALRKTGA